MSTATSTITAVQPYLIFNGRCEEASEFYIQALGAKVEMKSRYSESPVPMSSDCMPAGNENKIMHMSLEIGGSTVMMSDGRNAEDKTFSNFSLSVSLTDVAEAEQVFAALSAGGKVEMPLTPTFWSKSFGMLEDKFGVSWMVNVA